LLCLGVREIYGGFGYLKRNLSLGAAPNFLAPLKHTGHPEAVHVHLRPV